MMNITFTANPALNYIWKVINYDHDRGADVQFLKKVVGGSGIVVSRVLNSLKENTMTTCFLAGKIGREIEQMLRTEGFSFVTVWAEGNSRTTSVYIGPKDGNEIEYKELGPLIKDQQITEILSFLEKYFDNAKSIFISGSVPPKTNSSIYGRIVKLANKFGVRSFVDAESVYLTSAIKQQPYLVKCNSFQASEYFSKKINSYPKAIDALTLFLKIGANSAMISLGSKGCVYTQRSWDYALISKPPHIEPIDTSGSGDSLLACFSFALEQNEDIDYALKFGTAGGMVNSFSIGAGVDLDPETINIVSKKIIIKKVKL